MHCKMIPVTCQRARVAPTPRVLGVPLGDVLEHLSRVLLRYLPEPRRHKAQPRQPSIQAVIHEQCEDPGHDW